jgi:hypothetical protein
VSVRTVDAGARGGGAAWRRDLALLVRMARMVFAYSTAGARLRRAYRRCEARADVLWLDEIGETRHREEALRRR